MNRKLAALLGAAAIVVTGGWGAAAPAMASTHHAAAAKRVGDYKLCLRSDHSQCLTSEGSGNQMQIHSSGYSTFNQTTVGSGAVIFITPSGLCVHGTISGAVTTSSSCGSSNTASQFNLVTQNGTLEFQNVAYGGLLSTKGDTGGDNVFLQLQGTGGAWFVTDLLS